MKRLFQLLFVLMLAPALVAQEGAPRKVHRIYKASFVIYELEDGKRINERSYMLPVTSVDGNSRDSVLRTGTRVPVAVKEKEITYVDAGISIICNIIEQGDKYILFTSVEISSVVPPDPGADPRAGSTPVLRTVRENSTTLVYPGKPTLVASVDDVNSKKRTQIEVTATRIE